jgi:hypothetical protein
LSECYLTHAVTLKFESLKNLPFIKAGAKLSFVVDKAKEKVDEERMSAFFLRRAGLCPAPQNQKIACLKNYIY